MGATQNIHAWGLPTISEEEVGKVRGHRGTSGADIWKPATFIPPTPPWLRAAGEGSEGHGAGSLTSPRLQGAHTVPAPSSLPLHQDLQEWFDQGYYVSM